MWAANGIINDTIGAKTPEELAIRRTQVNKRTIAAIIISALAIATFSQITYALPAADYSKHHKVVAGVISLIAAIIIPTRSLQLTMQHARKKYLDAQKNPILLKIQQATVALLHEKKAEYTQMNNDEQLNTYYTFANITSTPLQANPPAISYFKELVPNATTPDSSYYSKGSKLLGTISGILLTGIFEYAIAEYTFDKTKQLIWSNDIAAGVFASLATATTLYLFGKSIIATSERVMGSLAESLCCKRVRSLGEKLHPIPSYILKVEEAVTNIFALGTSVIIWGEFYPSPTWKHYFFIGSITTAVYLLLLTASLDIVDGGLQKATRNSKKKKIFTIDEMYQTLANGFKDASQEEFASFVGRLPKEAKLQLCAKAGLKLNELDEQLETADTFFELGSDTRI